MTSYRCRRYVLPAELEDDLVADLWELGTLGVQSTPLRARGGRGGGDASRVRVEAWFPAETPGGLEELLKKLEARWCGRGAEALGSERVPEADWLALWRRGAQPIPVGERLLLDPREPERSDPGVAGKAVAAGRRLLRLPARRAFGTGSHETTRLTLLLLEDACREGKVPPPGSGPTGRVSPRRVLDVGTGTGVLAFAALLFGVPRVVAYDRDPVAVAMARENGHLNGFGTHPSRPCTPLFFAGTADALAPDGRAAAAGTGFDLVLINILPHLVDADLPRLLRTVAPGGAVAMAGMLAEEGAKVTKRLADLGFEPTAERREGAWVAWRFERVAP